SGRQTGTAVYAWTVHSKPHTAASHRTSHTRRATSAPTPPPPLKPPSPGPLVAGNGHRPRHEAVGTMDNFQVNTGSTRCPESSRCHPIRFGLTMPPRELDREHANPVSSTFNPKVAGSN